MHVTEQKGNISGLHALRCNTFWEPRTVLEEKHVENNASWRTRSVRYLSFKPITNRAVGQWVYYQLLFAIACIICCSVMSHNWHCFTFIVNGQLPWRTATFGVLVSCYMLEQRLCSWRFAILRDLVGAANLALLLFSVPVKAVWSEHDFNICITWIIPSFSMICNYLPL